MKRINRNGSVLIVLLLLQLNINDGASVGGSLTSYRDGDDEHVVGHAIDAQRTDADYTNDSIDYENSDKVISTVININDSNTASILKNFNVSKEEILRKMAAQQQPDVPTTPQNNDQQRPGDDANITSHENTEQERFILDAIKKQIESSVVRNLSRPDPNTDFNELAFYPVCSKNNETSWLEDNTAKLYFSHNILGYLAPSKELHHAILRLRLKHPNTSNTDRLQHEMQPPACGEPDEIIRVTVSVMAKRAVKGGNNRGNANSGSNRREFKTKKVMCNSFVTNRIREGWVEIDMRQVIKHWMKAYRNSQSTGVIVHPMVAIDVEDDQHQPLKAGLLFEANDCQLSQSHGASMEKSPYGMSLRQMSCLTTRG